jgi:hypothetical protein
MSSLPLRVASLTSSTTGLLQPDAAVNPAPSRSVLGIVTVRRVI